MDQLKFLVKPILRSMPPLTCLASIIVTFVSLFMTWTHPRGNFYGELEQRTWYPSPKMIDRKADWVTHTDQVIARYTQDCPLDPTGVTVRAWPSDEFSGATAFCDCLGQIICEEGNKMQNNHTKIDEDTRRKIVQCQLRDIAAKKECGSHCAVPNLNIGYLFYTWNWISLLLALEVFYTYLSAWSEKPSMRLFPVIWVVAIILYFVPLMLDVNQGDKGIFIMMPFLYYIVKAFLLGIRSYDPKIDMGCWAFSMVCNGTYLFTVPIGVAILYASGFMLDGHEATVVIFMSSLIPALQVLATLPHAMGDATQKKMQKAAVVTCSVLVALFILMPQSLQFNDTCEAARPQYWKKLSTWGVWAAILVNSIYPILEVAFLYLYYLLTKMGFIKEEPDAPASGKFDLYSQKNGKCFYATSFFILMDLITRSQLAFDSDKLGCLLHGRC